MYAMLMELRDAMQRHFETLRHALLRRPASSCRRLRGPLQATHWRSRAVAGRLDSRPVSHWNRSAYLRSRASDANENEILVAMSAILFKVAPHTRPLQR